MYFSQLCQRCYKCVAVCPNNAIQALADGSLHTDRDSCTGCGKCTETCPAEARQISGKLMTVSEVVEEVRKDARFYSNSGGGVTLSGGEPTTQPEFLFEILKSCQERGYHTALDTCGYTRWKVLEPLLQHVDLVLYDIKHMDPEAHRRLTGVGNELILDNARKLVGGGTPLIVRVPLIPGCNDSEENIRATAAFAVELGGVEVNLMPYHTLGLSKHDALDWDYKLCGAESLGAERVAALVTIVQSYGVPVQTG